MQKRPLRAAHQLCSEDGMAPLSPSAECQLTGCAGVVCPQELLSALPAGVETHYVGKRGGQPSIKQQAINQLLVSLCQQV